MPIDPDKPPPRSSMAIGWDEMTVSVDREPVYVIPRCAYLGIIMQLTMRLIEDAPADRR